MKTNIFVAVFFLFFIGCTPRQNEPLTQQQKDQIKGEVKSICDSIWAKMGKLDVTDVFQHFSDSPEFVAYNPDGSRSDFQALKKSSTDFVNSASAVKLVPAREDFYVLAKDVVIYAWYGKSEISMKSGDKITYDPDAETFIFHKMAGQWKIVYVHESATIAEQKAGKKK